MNPSSAVVSSPVIISDAPLPVSVPMVESTTGKADEIFKKLSEHFDESEAKALLIDLYHEGVRAIQAEVQGRSLFANTANPTMVTLSKVVALDKIAQQTELHRILSKVYRVFIELTWFQSWQQGKGNGSMPVFRDTKIAAIENVQRVLGIYKDYPHLDTRHEYRCAEQAAHLLTPSETAWKKYLSGAKALSGAASLSIGDALIGLKEVVVECSREGVEDWYLPTFSLRWLLLTATTPQDLLTETIQAALSHYVEKCKHEGHNYTQSLLMIFMEILQNPIATQELKDLVVRGNAQLPGIIELFQWDYLPFIASLVDKLGPFGSQWTAKLDPLRNARFLALQFLSQLASDRQFERYREESLEAMHRRNVYLQQQHKLRFENENAALNSTIDQLAAQKNALAIQSHELEMSRRNFIHSDRKMYVIEREQDPIEQKDIYDAMVKMNKEIDKVSEQQRDIEKLMQQKILELKELKDLKVSLEELDKQEIRFLQSALNPIHQ